MEPVGLAVGLVGLFSTCMDVMQRIDSYRTAGRDSRQLDAQLNATMHLLEKWGDGVGISKGKLSDNHHPDLDNPRTFAVVQGLLNSIKDFSATSDEPPSPRGLQKTPSFPSSGDLSSHGSKISRWQKTSWALRGKLKQTSHVQALASLVSDLYNVVSPDTTGSKALTRTPSFKDLSISAGEQPYAVEIRELLQKIEEEMEGNDSNDKRVQKTCEWILHRDEFLEWQKPSSSSKLLWIKGPAGFGKTVLCARIVQELERTAQEPVAYFFLSSRYDGRDDPFSAIRAWLTMMIQRSPAARDIVTKTRLSQHEPLASQATILRAFRELIVGVPGCILVLDGLDECTGMTNTDTKSVPHFLQELRIAITNTTTKILISSRGDPVIQQGISDFTGYSEYTIIPDDVGPDLMAYSSELVKAKLPNKDEPTRASIAQKMTNRSEGQFQWVKLQEGSLRKGRSRKQLEREIDETPSGLDSLYDREWNRINAMGDSDRERALSLLRWTAFALRPLTVHEITEAVLLTEGMDELPVDEMPDCVDQDYVDSMILELCGSLIEVRHVSSSESIEHPECIQQSEEYSVGFQEVHLSHFSVKEYLLLKIFPGTGTLLCNEKLRVTNGTIHNTTLAKHCLRFISFPGAWESLKMSDNKRPTMHFMLYAADSCGLTDTVAHLIREGRFDMNDRSFGNSTPLFWACFTESKNIVELLVENGADINARCYQGQVPLHNSVQDGNDGIMELLISKGADVSVVDDERQTPLNLVSMSGNTKAARQLIDRGADISHETTAGFTPLSMASSRGHVELAKLLIKRGADVNQVVANGPPPLLLAVCDDHSELAGLLIDEELLLQSGADVNTSDVRGYTPLYMASLGGFIDIVEILTQKGAGLNVKTVAGETPLHASSAMGHLRVTQLLIQHGADVASKDNSGRNPLHYACRSGDLEVVNLIIGSSQTQTLDEADHWGSTPLSLAARFGGVGILMALIDTGAVEVESSDMFGRTTKWWATSHNHDAVARLLAGTDGHRDLGTDVEEGEAVQEQGLEMGTYCDICWLFISGQTHVRCGICNGGNFDVCSACLGLGGHCFDQTHELVPGGCETQS
ncbi:Ankyrin repeat domain-containing protein 50 [Fusarium odoratissimum]|uniref:Ankyrin repeat domain-containing protein 50 n=1 Tax=Fusarium oxysporum f. sp. cubense (strain race 4) TaxID=2502994 RepID=N1SB15_FUSC4|nr:Ankyrin repeat domain-containing protein 50 [Fusarium odoratissimum]